MPKQFNPVRIRDPKKVMRFGSRTGTPSSRALSNFQKITLVLNRAHFSPLLLKEFPILAERFPDEAAHATFTSTEAAWQALKARDLITFGRFEASGDLGEGSPTPASFAPFLPRIHQDNRAKLAAKYHHWIESKKGIRYDNVGIIPKMAANPKYRIALGLGPDSVAYDREYLHPNVEEEIWMVLLRAKADQNPPHPEHPPEAQGTPIRRVLEERQGPPPAGQVGRVLGGLR